MIDLETLIMLLAFFFTSGGAAIAFFQMQTKQNMKIAQTEKDLKEVKRKNSEQSKYQIKTEKDIIKMNEKLDHILEMMRELKDKGCGNCGNGRNHV